MRVAILGAGAMGSLIGSFLEKSGMDVTLIDPYREHMDISLILIHQLMILLRVL